MRLHNSDVDEAERSGPHDHDEDELEFEEEEVESFFDLRQRTLVGMDQMSAFRIVALGVLRKLRTNLKGSVLYGEVEDALGRYFRLLDGDMQKFASLHETLRDAADRQDPKATGAERTALAAAQSILLEAMREIAVVLLACGEMQRRALDLKMMAQRSISEQRTGPPLISFSKFAEFLEEALAVCDQLRRKHEELHQQRMRAMAGVAEARVAAAAASSSSSAGAAAASSAAAPAVAPDVSKVSFTPPPRDTAEGQRQAAVKAAAEEQQRLGPQANLQGQSSAASAGRLQAATASSPRPPEAAAAH